MDIVTLNENLLTWKRNLAREVGTESPCPQCQTPRVQRSDYIRCHNCGLNWLNGEDRTCHPSFSRCLVPMGTGPQRSANI